MTFLNQVQLAKELDVPLNTVITELVKNKLKDKVTNVPTKKAFDGGYAQEGEYQGKFKGTKFYLWNVDKMRELINPQQAKWEDIFLTKTVVKETEEGTQIVKEKLSREDALEKTKSGLNSFQREIVEHQEGLIFVLAAAGSGKTTCLTVRIANLIEHGVNPFGIVSLTFTKQAAGSMREKVKSLVGGGVGFTGTFHSFCHSIVMEHKVELGLPKDLQIFDDNQALTVARNVAKEKGWEDKIIRLLREKMSRLKNNLQSIETFNKNNNMWDGDNQKLSEFYSAYQAKMKEHHALDFDDIQVYCYELLKNNQLARAKIQSRIEYLMIDEYQDTNLIQYELTKLFGAPQNNISVTGDHCQNIYSFRGTSYVNLSRFQEDFKPTIYKLPVNYRSHQTILDVAYEAIEENGRLHPVMQMTSGLNRGYENKVQYGVFDTPREEAQAVIKKIKSMIDNGANPKQITVAVRTNFQTRVLEDECISQGIPYSMRGGFEFFERREIKDLIAYLKLCLNPQDEESLIRVEKLGKGRATNFFEWLSRQDKVIENSPTTVLNQILNATNYMDRFNKDDPLDTPRIENIGELKYATTHYETLEKFLESVFLIQTEQMKETEQEGIVISTLHALKGMEYESVFMVGLSNSILPHFMAKKDGKEAIAEERRLFYVGITRAKNNLFFSRYEHGGYPMKESQFLKNISKKYLEDWKE